MFLTHPHPTPSALVRILHHSPEMFNAVECRQSLVQRFAAEKPQWIRHQLPNIKTRALLTNLMISRDLVGLEAALTSIRIKGDDRAMELAEFAAAVSVITTRYNVISELELAIQALHHHHRQNPTPSSTAATAAIVGGVTDGAAATSIVVYHEGRNKAVTSLLVALANAAYAGIAVTTPAVAQGYNALLKSSNDARILLFPLLQAMRSGNLLDVDAALTAASDMGWHHDVLHPALPVLIIKRRAQMVKAEAARSHIMRLALAAHNGFRPNISELFTALRRGRQLGLDNIPSLHLYFNTLYTHLAANASLVKQEEQLQHLIDSADIDGLEDLLSGRGAARLVVNAPSAELCDAWMQALGKACTVAQGVQSSEETPVVMLGTMEKAARTATGVLRGWRHRYFMLDGGMLSYFTSKDGEQKGAIHVGGGAVRRLSQAEAAGRDYAFELQEGMDTSGIDIDLIGEAAAVVRRFRLGSVKQSIAKAMKKNDLEALGKLLGSCVCLCACACACA